MLKIRKFKKTDTTSVTNLIIETYRKFNYKEGSKKAVQDYIDRLNVKKRPLKEIQKIFCTSSICYVATDKNKIIGIVRGRPNRVVNLFVDAHYHGRGIGKKLMEKFEVKAKRMGSNEIRIRASLYATPFYQKIGYKKTSGKRKLFGLCFFPMKKFKI